MRRRAWPIYLPIDPLIDRSHVVWSRMPAGPTHHTWKNGYLKITKVAGSGARFLDYASCFFRGGELDRCDHAIDATPSNHHHHSFRPGPVAITTESHTTTYAFGAANRWIETTPE